MNGGFAGPVAEALRLLPGYLGSHVLVSVTALALGLIVSVPLAILSAHRPALRGALLADRVAVMQAGRVIAQGSPHALMSGAHGDYVDELMATPRRQAEQLAALIDRGARA